MDTETTYTNLYHKRKLMGISIYVDNNSYYVPTDHIFMGKPYEYNHTNVADLFVGVRSELVFHNEGFDRVVLEKAGVKIPEKSYDTMLMSHLINEDEFLTKKAQHSLDSCAKVYLGVDHEKETEAKKIMEKFGWEKVPPSGMAVYAEKDAEVTNALYHRLKPEFAIYEDYWTREHGITDFIARMRDRGIIVDVPECRRLRELCQQQLNDVIRDIGFDPAKEKIRNERLFGEPPFGLGLPVLTRTPKTGKPQVNAKFLRETNHPIAGLISQHNRIKKLLTSYYNPYLERCDESYSYLHADFRQHGTETGRWSCADPNMQQIPRDSPIKKLFLPESGKQLWEIDYRNLEWRFAAVLSNEEKLIDLFRAEGDFHQLNADILGVSRQDSKIGGFTALFMGGANAIVESLGVPYPRAAKFMRDFREGYPAVNHTMKLAEGACQKNGGWIRLWSGRRRHYRFPSEYYTAFNALVQGGSFELVKSSILDADKQGVDIRNVVHDSIWIVVDNEQEVIDVQHIMEDWTEEAFGLKFSTDRKRLN